MRKVMRFAKSSNSHQIRVKFVNQQGNDVNSRVLLADLVAHGQR